MTISTGQSARQVDIVAGAQELEQQPDGKALARESQFWNRYSLRVRRSLEISDAISVWIIRPSVTRSIRHPVWKASAGAGEILVSEQVYEALKDRIRVTEKGMIPLKGKAKEICVYSVEEVL